MDGVINFSDFFKNSDKKLPKFNKEELLNDFFIEDEKDLKTEESSEVEIKSQESITEIVERDSVDQNSIEEELISSENTVKTMDNILDRDDIEKLIQKEVERLRIEAIKENVVSDQSVVLPIQSEESEEINESSEEFYKVYNDKSETFTCEIELEGANIKDTEVRLILETDNWNLMFPGEIDSYGKVSIPIRKLNLFDEGVKGVIKMEVIAEGTVFIPWTDNFEVKMSKKVMVKFNENKSQNQKPKLPINPSVKVNLRK